MENYHDETVYRDRPAIGFLTFNKKKPLSSSDWVDKTIRDNSVKNVLKSIEKNKTENKPENKPENKKPL